MKKTIVLIGFVLAVLAGAILFFVRPIDREEAPQPSAMMPGEMETATDETFDLPWLESRRQAQLEQAADFDVFHDFGFADRVEESGIRFRHRIVDDAGKTYKGVHYDHGNGIAVADVDGDGLYDIYFVTQIGGNELWRNLGEGRFENITSYAGVALADRIAVAASFADIDNDGDPDLYVTSVRSGNVLFENDGSGRFRDISEVSGLAHRGHSSGAVFFDYNRDGLLDLFLTNIGQYTSEVLRTMVSDEDGAVYQFYDGFSDAFSGHLFPERSRQSILFKNLDGTRFVDVSAEARLIDTGWTGDASPLDANEDGWPDLYVLNMQGHDEYYENVEGTHFINKSRELFPRTPWGSMGINVFDYDNDGRLDLFITDMHSDMSENIGSEREKLKSRMLWPESFLRSGGASIHGNAFYRNQGRGRFKEISDEIGAETYWPWGPSIGDLNADGYDDVFITAGMNYPFRYGINSLLLNDRGERFLDSEFILGVEPRRDRRMATPWFTLDCSGRDRGHTECRGRPGRGKIWAALGSRAAVIFDLDDDGDLDIVTNDFNSEPMVLTSNLTQQKSSLRFLKVNLIGTRSNRGGLGAVVKVRAGGRTYTKVQDGKSGYLSQSLLPLYFGLGEAEAIDQIEVFWPSGQRQTVSRPIEMNSLIEVVER